VTSLISSPADAPASFPRNPTPDTATGRLAPPTPTSALECASGMGGLTSLPPSLQRLLVDRYRDRYTAYIITQDGKSYRAEANSVMFAVLLALERFHKGDYQGKGNEPPRKKLLDLNLELDL
jgi:hypothetical protein